MLQGFVPRPTRAGASAGIVALVLILTSLFGVGDLAAQDEPPREPPDDWGPIAITMESVPYPEPVHLLDLTLFDEDVRLAYMDVEPSGTPNGRTVVLMHGFNFFGEYFDHQIDALTEAGFRVVVPDRIGFGRSSKPTIPYSLSMMADNTRKLLDHLGVDRAAVVGHSMGGKVATRFAFLFPDRTTHLVLLNSIGLREPRPGGGWGDPDESYRRNLNRTYDDIRGQRRYYVEWQPEYAKYMRIHYGWLQSSDWPRMAMVRTLLGQANDESIVYDWPQISTKALVMGGAEDGENYPEQVRNAAEQLQNAEVHLIPDIGHNAHFVVPDQVHEALIPFLESEP